MPLRQNTDKIDVRDIPQLNVCAPMRARCVVNTVYATDTKSHREMSHGEVTQTTKSLNAFTPEGRVNTAFTAILGELQFLLANKRMTNSH